MNHPALLLLDADLVISHLRRRPEAERWLAAHLPATLAISTVTLFELESGVHLSRDQDLERRNVARLLRVIALRPFDADAARHAAAIRAALGRSGAAIGPYGTLLAGHAVALGTGVVTGNQRELSRVKGLHLESMR